MRLMPACASLMAHSIAPTAILGAPQLQPLTCSAHLHSAQVWSFRAEGDVHFLLGII